MKKVSVMLELDCAHPSCRRDLLNGFAIGLAKFLRILVYDKLEEVRAWDRR